MASSIFGMQSDTTLVEYGWSCLMYPDPTRERLDLSLTPSMMGHQILHKLPDIGHIFPNLKYWRLRDYPIRCQFVRKTLIPALQGLSNLEVLHLEQVEPSTVPIIISEMAPYHLLESFTFKISLGNEQIASITIVAHGNGLHMEYYEPSKEPFSSIIEASVALDIVYRDIRCIVYGKDCEGCEQVFPYMDDMCNQLEFPTYLDQPPQIDPNAWEQPMNAHDILLRTDATAFADIHRLHSLTHLKIHRYGGLAISPENLRRLAEGCPHLITCLLGNEMRKPCAPLGETIWTLHLCDIIRFASECKHLEDFGCLFDARKVVCRQAHGDEEKLGSKSLKTLRVGVSAVGEDYEEVADFLLAAFPDLRHIKVEYTVHADVPEYLYLSLQELQTWMLVEARLSLNVD